MISCGCFSKTLESFLERLQNLPRPRGVLASLFYFPDDGGEMSPAFGDMPICLGQMLARVHRHLPVPQSSSASHFTASAAGSLNGEYAANQHAPVGPLVVRISMPHDFKAGEQETWAYEFCCGECLGAWVTVHAGGVLLLDQK